MKRRNGLIVALRRAPYFTIHKEENYWLFIIDPVSNTAWVWQKVSFMDEATAVTVAPKAIQESLEGSGANFMEINVAVKDASYHI